MKNTKLHIYAAIVLVFMLSVGVVSCKIATQSCYPLNETTGNLIICYDSTMGKEALLKAVKKEGDAVVYEYKNINSITIKLSGKRIVEKSIRYYSKVKGVLSVQKDRLNQLD